MKTRIVQTLLLLLMSHVTQAQDLVGQWSGKLQVQGTELSIIFHVSKTNDHYEVTMDSPGQNAMGNNVSSTIFSYPKVRFEMRSIGATYEGVVTDAMITGKWVQSGTALFLTLSRSEASAPPKDAGR